jgi:hypothetical protein
MKSYSEYTWLQSYFDNDAFWLEDVISWDESFELFLTDYNIFFFLTSPFFINVHKFLCFFFFFLTLFICPSAEQNILIYVRKRTGIQILIILGDLTPDTS